MFDKLKRAFSNAAKSISQKELSEKDLDKSLFDLNIALLESDVSQEVIDDLSSQIKNNLVGLKLQKNETTEQIIATTLRNNFAEILSKAGSIDLISKIQEKKNKKAGPFVIVFLGINGTGKTTTVAKVADLLKRSGFSIVIAAADTHRAGAIEQISSHAERLSIKIISQRYGADPSAVARDALEYAKKHYVDVVLIDTAGRMQTAKNLMDEIGKIVKVIKPDIKLFVGDSLSGNDTINQAREFFSYTSFDGAILTKSDADAKGGAAISISYITSKPILYLGIGQGYEDLIPFDKEKFLETIFDSKASDKSLLDSHTISKAADVYDIEKDTESPEYIESQYISGNTFTDKSLQLKYEDDKNLISDKDEFTFNRDDDYEVTSNMTQDQFDKSQLNSDGGTKPSIDKNYADNIDENKLREDDRVMTSDESITEVIEDRESTESTKKKGLFGWFKKKK